MISAFILHIGVIDVAFSVVLLAFNALTGAYYPGLDSVRENYKLLTGFLLVGVVLVAVGGMGLMLGW